MTEPSLPPRPSKPESPLWNILFNVALPAVVLSKLSTPERLGPVVGLIVALSAPVAYGIYDLVVRKKTNAISIIGFVSVLLSGGLGLLKLGNPWFALKEAAVPLTIGIAIVVSSRGKQPLVKKMLYNENVIDIVRVDRELTARSNGPAFDRLLTVATWMLAASFFLSAVLNFILANVMLKSPTGTPAFNEELGKMMGISYPVIVLPCMVITMGALAYLLFGIKRLTGLELDTILKGAAAAEAKKEAAP